MLVLIGLRLSGKSTLGPIVAAHLNLEFVDLDQSVLNSLGAATVAQAFRDLGEGAWRDAERVELARVLAEHSCGVLSLGGGTPMAPGVADMLRAAQSTRQIRIALLDPGESELASRLAANRGDRPLLESAGDSGDSILDAHAEVRSLYATRMALYRSLANVIVDTSQSRKSCVEQLIAALLPGA